MTIKLSDITGIHAEQREYKLDSRLILPKCFIGIEIEAEGCKNIENLMENDKIRGLWEVTTDGSLRNHGVEFISRKLIGRDIIRALETLNTTTKGSKSPLVFSDRCSTHIHIDFRGFTVAALVKFIVIYCIFEEFLFSIVPKSRQNNNHARKIITNSRLGHYITQLCSVDNFIVERGIHDWPKYTAMNIKPLIRQGSIEFRHLEGTMDKGTIVNWINMIMSLKRYVIYSSLTTQGVIDSVCSTPRELFTSVFIKHKSLWRESLVEGMLEGARFVQANITDTSKAMEELFATKPTKKKKPPLTFNESIQANRGHVVPRGVRVRTERPDTPVHNPITNVTIQEARADFDTFALALEEEPTND